MGVAHRITVGTSILEYQILIAIKLPQVTIELIPRENHGKVEMAQKGLGQIKNRLIYSDLRVQYNNCLRMVLGLP